MLFTVNSFSFSERIAFTEASAAEIFWATAVERDLDFVGADFGFDT